MADDGATLIRLGIILLTVYLNTKQSMLQVDHSYALAPQLEVCTAFALYADSVTKLRCRPMSYQPLGLSSSNGSCFSKDFYLTVRPTAYRLLMAKMAVIA